MRSAEAAAADPVDRAGEVAGARAAQPGHRGGDLAGLEQAPQQRLRGERLLAGQVEISALPRAWAAAD